MNKELEAWDRNYNNNDNNQTLKTYPGYNGVIPNIMENGNKRPHGPTGKPRFTINVSSPTKSKKDYLQIPLGKKMKKMKKRTFLRKPNNHKSKTKKEQSTFKQIISQLTHANPNQKYRKIHNLTPNMSRKNALRLYMASTKKNPRLKPKGWY